MKRFYLGNVENLILEKTITDNNKSEIKAKRVIIKENELFYKNCLGSIIRFSDNSPLLSYKEMEEYMYDSIETLKKVGIYNSGAYYDEASLKPINFNKEERKELKVLRKKR